MLSSFRGRLFFLLYLMYNMTPGRQEGRLHLGKEAGMGESLKGERGK